MTRFARSKGSKSSNSKRPEDSTEWSVMKESLQDKVSSKKVKDNEPDTWKVSPVNKKAKHEDEPKWADFGSPVCSSVAVQKRSRKRKDKGESDFLNEYVQEDSPKKKVRSVRNNDMNVDLDTSGMDLEEHQESLSTKKKKKLKQKANMDTESNENFGCLEEQGISSSKKKKKSKPNLDVATNPGHAVQSSGFGKKEDAKGSKMKPKDRQKKVNWKSEESSTLIVNGIHISVTKFGGYHVKTEDAERLTALRKTLKKKGIPEDEIDKAMKLERRKAEKALTKARKKVCFQCRKPGHSLSDCPQSKNFVGRANGDEVATGLCYKCGSTEHTHFECKVQKAGEFRFATCFICKEQGHISSQCPDNPKGLYPRGGGCNICGQVTHLKKDCPQLAKTRSESVVTLDTLSSGIGVEEIDGNSSKFQTAAVKSSKKKVVKF